MSVAGWSSLVARRAHNPKVVGSNPAPATNKNARLIDVAGWSSLVARRAHNPKVVGSNPAPATSIINNFSGAGWSSLVARRAHNPKVVGSNPAPATISLKHPFMHPKHHAKTGGKIFDLMLTLI